MCTWALDQWARSEDQFFVGNQGLTNWITTFGLLAALALRFGKSKTVFRPFTREAAAMIAIYSLAGFSWFWSIRQQDTIEQLQAMYKIIIVFGFLMPMVISDLTDLKATFYTVLTVGTTIAVLVLATGKFEGRNLMFETGNVLTEKGLQSGNPLAIASMAAYVGIIAMLMNFRGTARFWQFLRYAVTAVAFGLSVKSGSRGQTVAMFFCVLCFLPYSRRFKDLRSFGALAISLTIFGIITLYLLQSLTGEQTVGHSYSDRWTWDSFVGEYSASRVGTSMTLLRAWASASPIYWLIGLGSSASFDPAICGFYPHVVFAEVLGELGLVGWIILWLFPIFTLQDMRELWGYVKEDAEERGLVASLCGLSLFEIIMSFKQGSLLGSGICFGFIIIMGRITVTCRQRALQYQTLDAGMYAMSPDDWEESGEAYDDSSLPGGALVARGG